MRDEKLAALWDKLPDRASIVNLAAREFGSLARNSFATGGRGYIVGPLVTGSGKVQAIYILERDIDTDTGTPASLIDAVRETVATYDPKKEFVMMAVSKTRCALIAVELLQIT